MLTILSSCKEETKDYVLISGTVNNPKVNEISINRGELRHKITIAEDGTFKDTLRITNAGIYKLGIKRDYTPVYLAQGDELSLNANGAKFSESVIFNGENANTNNYLAEKKAIKDSLTGNFQKFYGLDEKAFITKLNDIEKQLNDYLEAKNLPKAVITIEKKNNFIDKAASTMTYPQYHGMAVNNREFKVSDTFPSYADDIDFTNENVYNNSSSIKLLMLGYYMKKVTKASETTGDFGLGLQEAMKDVPNGIVKNNFLMHASTMTLGPNENLKSNYEYYMATSTNEENKKFFTKQYNEVKHLAKGTPSPSFNYENHKGGKTTLEDLRGKYVYIDVWATWCSPCKKEIPYLKEVEKEFHDANIEFVSISVDKKKDYDTWKKMVNDLELGGVQLIADNDRNSKWYHEYKIKGIPRFILIDTKGNIISADAPRPSNPALKVKLNALLEKA